MPLCTGISRVLPALVVGLVVFLLPSAVAGTWIALAADGVVAGTDTGVAQVPQVSVPWYSDNGVQVSVRTAGVELARESVEGGEFVRVELPESPLAGGSGAPGLPVVRRIFQVQPGTRVDLAVGEMNPVVIDLATAGFPTGVLPMQGPFSHALGGTVTETGLPRTSVLAHAEPLQYDVAVYTVDDSLPAERASVTRLGIARGVELWLLEVQPVAYNPARGSLTVWPEIDVTLQFTGGPESRSNLRPSAGLNRLVLNPPPQRTLRGERGGNFLVVTAQDFVGSAPLNQFLDAKAAQGFTMTSYTATPGVSRDAIKNYIKSLWGGSNTPDYILIVGDALGMASTAGTFAVPCWPAGPPRGAGTDLYYACMDSNDDWLPDIPIGRFPVRTVADLQNMVDKTLYVETGEFDDPTYTRRAAFIAGTDPAADAETLHNYVIDAYMTPAGVQSEKLYVQSYGADTQDVKDALNSGVFLVSCFGHAAGFQAWGQPLFTFSDIESLTNQNLYPFVASFTCSPAAFHYTDPTGSPGFLEKWMLVGSKGAAAAYGEGWSLDDYAWSTWGNQYKFLMRAIYADNIRALGPACQTAAQYFVSFYGPTDPVSRDYAEEFILQGDPSMRLPEPQGIHYLVIAAEGYVGTAPLSQFIAHKEARGYHVSVYSVPAGTTKETIKAYIQNLWGTLDAPQYVLIVGDTSGSPSTATTIPHWTGLGSKQATTDLPYACMDAGDDWYPDIAIGRFSCTTEVQLQTVVDKTIAVETGSFSNPDYVKRVAFLANPDTYNTAEPTDEWVISTYLNPRGYQPIRIYAAQGGDGQDVTDAVNTGCVMVTYMGHSGSYGWSSPGFNQDSVRALLNNGLYPLVFGWSCNTAHYDIDECFGETWIREANKGAAAYLSASNYIYWGSVEAWLPSAILEKAFFTAIFADNIWNVGPAWQDGLYRFLDEYGQPAYPGGPPTQNVDVVRNFFEEFVLLGDPSLQLPQPNGFTLTVTPPTQSLCCPPDNTALYTISVEKLGTFAEPVTLTVQQGAPSGATISFGTNGAVPPFASVLAVNNLAGAAAGGYDIVIRGTSATKQQSALARLNVASAVPAAAAPALPPDGATDVPRQLALTWQGAVHAVDYEVEIAGSPDFTEIIYSTTTPQTSVEVGTYLDAATTYCWRVKARNGCGDGVYSPVFHFTTVLQRDHYAQLFSPSSGNFDLSNTSLFFIPDGSVSVYRMCGAPATDLPTDPNGGTVLTFGDDTSQEISLPQSILFFGVSYSSVFVNANGNITFSSGDGAYNETLAQHFSQPRVSAVFDDLNPSVGGQISWLATADRVAVTFLNVPEFNTSNQNTFQIEFLYSGEVHITWLAIASVDSVAGLSPGGGLPPDFQESDLSAYGPCDQPDGFGLSVTPRAQELCCPPNNTVFYTISVIRRGNFAEPVTLALQQGAPPGATINFSPNGATPPFTSVMTASTLAGSPAGAYDLLIDGTSATQQHLVQTRLNISNTPPAAPVLVSPTNGSVNIARQPTLTWQAAARAAAYDVEVSPNAGFTPLVFSTTTAETTASVGIDLDAATSYWWRVKAHNACGDGSYSTVFRFTTVLQRDSFTQLFSPSTGNFDLTDTSLFFIPDGSANGYRMCGAPAAQLPTDPNNGTVLTFGDDTSQQIAFPQSIAFFGVSYSSCFVNANGNVSFTSADGTYDETIARHFSQPRVSAVFDDLNPAVGGQISWKATADRVAVTYLNVPEFNTSNQNTFQVEFLYNGEVHVTWLAVASLDSVAGLSPGGGLPPDFQASDLSVYGPCVQPGACCLGEICSLLLADDCQSSAGTFLGEDTACQPNPCVTYDWPCLIISEVVQGTESGDCPRFLELTNTGTSDFVFLEGGVIVQTDSSSDVVVDIDLTGVTIAAGRAFVIASNAGGVCTGAFPGIYGRPADFYTSATFGYGNERLIVTDTADGSHLLDIYGEFGVNGTGRPWEFTGGYSYRLPAWNSGNGGVFAPNEWFFGGVGSLAGGNPTQLLLDLTTPGRHAFAHPCTGLRGDMNCDGVVNFGDINPFVLALSNPVAYQAAYPDCHIMNGDCNGDGAMNFGDINPFVALLSGRG